MTTVFRVEKTKDFTTMSNYHFKDKRLNLRAKGLLSLMLSLPDDWDYSLAGLAAICNDGVYVIRTALNELEQAGYVERSQERNTNGRMGKTYIAYLSNLKTPSCNLPLTVKPLAAEPLTVNCTQ